jgi:outer membrane protein TolC
MTRLLCIAGLCLPAVGCLSGATNRSIDRALAESSAHLRERSEEPETLPDLGGPISRETIVALAVARSPGLAEVAHRARSMLHGAKAEGALPAPELGLEAWNLPLARPYAVGEADMYMVELRQRFPAAGSLDARSRAMADEAHAIVAELASEERQTAQRAAEAYADYVHGVRDHALAHDHLALLEQMQGAVRARFTTGGGGLADAARIDLEIAKTRRAIARLDGEIARARATINALLRRPADGPLGPPSDVAPMTVRLPVDALVTQAQEQRGTFVAARDRIRAAQGRREAAEAEARWPEFMVGVGYWQDPNMRPGYGASVSMSLPWLWSGHRDRIDEAREREAAEAAVLAGASVEAQSEITEAHARIVTAERELRVLQTQAVPAARRSIEAIRAVYTTGSASLLEWVDAARSLLDLEMEGTDISAELARAVAALERSVGATLPRTAVASEETP